MYFHVEIASPCLCLLKNYLFILIVQLDHNSKSKFLILLIMLSKNLLLDQNL